MKKKIAENKRDSILVNNLSICCRCERPHPELHEVFFGTGNREKSKRWKMILPLCHEDHRGNNGPHKNRSIDLEYKRLAQRTWENTYGTRKDFIKEFGKSYL